MNIPELLAEYETRLLKIRLLEFPAKLQHKKEELATERRYLAEAQNLRTEAEAILVSMVAAETNPNTGKPAFSNAEARTAELVRRKASDTEYQRAEKEYRDAEAAVNTLQFDLERLQDEFRAYRYVVDLTARELALMASDNSGGEKESGNGNSGNGDSRQRQPY